MGRMDTVSRRGFIGAVGAVLAQRSLAAAGAIDVIQVRKAAGAVRVEVRPLRGNVSVLLNGGGNMTKIAEALAGISQAPIQQLNYTHWHFDHTDGNEWVHAAGGNILAHENYAGV